MSLSPIGPERSLGTAYGFAAASLLAKGDDVFAAWIEPGGRGQARTVMVKVRRFGSGGELAGLEHPLRSPVVHEQNHMPRLMDHGDDVGLLWSRGTIAYVCAGCVPDDHVEFVILDGDDLTPRSDVVKLEYSATKGGLQDSEGLLRGNELLVTASVTYHVSSEGASATIECTP